MIAGMQPTAVLFHAFVGLALFLVWSNSLATLLFVRRPRVGKAPADAPFVSILVPARNEARRIARCLASLAA
jgi:hypothetical protein